MLKLNLLLNNPNILSGYLNLDPLHISPDKTMAKLDCLDSVACDGEADEIRAIDILEFFSYRETANILGGWARKLAHGATLIIGGVDADSVMRQYSQRRIDWGTTMTILYGQQDKPYNFKKNCVSGENIAVIMRGLGLKILEISYSNNEFIVKGLRP